MSLYSNVFTAYSESPKDVAILGDMLNPSDRRADYLQEKNTYAWLWSIAKVLQPKSLCEIGVRWGYSGIAFAKGCQSIQRYVGYDSESYIANSNYHAERNLLTLIDNVTLIRADSQKMTTCDGVFDLIYVDGDHSRNGSIHDIYLAASALASIGGIVVDDLLHCRPVGLSVVEFLVRNIDFQFLQFPSFRGTGLLLKV